MATLAYPADPFAALGLTRDASPQAIKARYYQLARKYHPNTNHGIDRGSLGPSRVQTPHTTDPALKNLSEHFHRIYDAYTILSKASQRQRYIEWATLEELDAAVESQRLDLEYLDYGDEESDGWSSDLDDFDAISYHKRGRRQSPSIVTDTPKTNISAGPSSRKSGAASPSPSPELRGRNARRRASPALPERLQEQENRADSAHRAATERRKKLNRIKRKEVEVFEAYRDAKIEELEAQIEAERLKDIYERTRAKRERMEKVPLETSTRVRMVQNILRATRLLRPTPRAPITRKLTISTSILNDELVNINSPMSARPGWSSHRRGFSSDISGDQTDSDEETPHPTFRHHYRSPTPNGRPAASRERSPIPSHVAKLHPVKPPALSNALGISLNTTDFHNSLDALIDPIDPKFKLFVKRPTGFDGHEIVEDLTSPIAAPAAVNLCREIMFLPNGIRLEAHSDAPTGENGNRGCSDSESDSSPARQNMLDIKVIGDKHFRNYIPSEFVHRLNINEESRLLGKPLDADSDPKQLLRQLEVWDAALAARFMVKPDIKAKFAFRLICSNRQYIRQTHRTFIALSYRRKKMVERHEHYFTLPLSEEMLQAVWEERISDEEGLWIDQISINQDDDRERDISMSAMDLVYRGARLIVVVLDDFEFEAHEAEILVSHMEEYERLKHVAPLRRFRRHSPAWLEAHEELFNIISKLLSSSWFRRAWCRHEMRLAKDHIFLIPCRTSGTFGQTIMRLSSSCLAHLLALATEVPFSPQIEILKPALHAFFRDRTEVTSHKTSRSHHGNFTTVAAEVFRMDAGGDPRLPPELREADARWDRMSIILNAMECGLALRPSANGSRQSLTNEDCFYSLLMLALAARDPGALCSAGKPLVLKNEGTGKEVSSWLFEPTVVDAGLNNYKTLTRLPLDAPLHTGVTRGAHWVQLDLKFLGEDFKAERQCAKDVPDLMQLSRDFVAKCEAQQWGRHRRRYLIYEKKANEFFGEMSEVYSQTLTGVFCCGPDWMSSICQRYGVGRWKQDLQSAYWLLVSLRNMNGKWPVLLRDDWTARAAAFIMDFVNFLVIRGLPHRQLKRPEAWRPVWVTTRNRGKVLTFSLEKDNTCPVIPCVLLDTDYRDLARLWILEPRTRSGQWTLLGKSVLFGDDLAKQVINLEDDRVRHQQKVYGRIT